MRSDAAGCTVIKIRLRLGDFSLNVSLGEVQLSPRRTSDVCVRRFRLRLHLGRAGNFPGTRRDGSLLATARPVAAGLLDAAAGTPGVSPAHLLCRAVALALPLLPLPPLPVQVGGGSLPVGLGRGRSLPRRLLLGSSVLLVAIGGVSALRRLLLEGPLLVLEPPLVEGRAGLLAGRTPGALGRLRLVLGALPGAGGAPLPLALSSALSAHVLLGSPVPSLRFPGAGRALGVLRPAALGGFHGTSGLGVAPAWLSALCARAAGAPLVLLGELLPSGSVGLPAAALVARARRAGCPPGVPAGEALRDRRERRRGRRLLRG